MSCTKGSLKRIVDLGSAHTSPNGDMGRLTTGIVCCLTGPGLRCDWEACLVACLMRMSPSRASDQERRATVTAEECWAGPNVSLESCRSPAPVAVN